MYKLQQQGNNSNLVVIMRFDALIHKYIRVSEPMTRDEAVDIIFKD